jgi:hypothetical protein
MSIKNLSPRKQELAPVEIIKKHEPLPDQCHHLECNKKATQLDFCEEHYDHFKFGLIKKNGEYVSDYEKKLEQYLSHQKRKKAA